MTNFEYFKSLNTPEDVAQFCNIMRYIGNQYTFTYYGEIDFLNSEYNQDVIDTYKQFRFGAF